MTGDIVHQMQHPLFEEANKRVLELEQQLAEEKAEYQSQIDEKDEIISNAESSINSQIKFFNNLLSVKEVIDGVTTYKERDSIPFDEFVEKVKDLELRRYENDWNVISTLGDFLGKVETPEPVVKTVYETRYEMSDKNKDIINGVVETLSRLTK